MFLAVCAITVWLAIIIQFILIITNRAAPVPETIIRFFSYYTILTNILVACCFTALLLKSRSAKAGFFTSSEVLTATTVYITIVGVVYNLILRHLWDPQGLQLIVDELLHTVIPLLFILYWFISVPKAGLQWKSIFTWLIYPLTYFIFILFRGTLSGFYPYPFIDVNDLGYNKALLNSVYITIAFILLSLFIVAFAKIISRKALKIKS